MTELEDAITEKKPQALPVQDTEPLSGEFSVNEAPPEQPGIYETPDERPAGGIGEEASPSPEELLRESSEAVRRMTEELRREDLIAERNAARARQTETARRKGKKRRYVYVGTFSAALSLIVMGAAMMISLFSPEGVISAFRIAPVMLIFLGIETLLAVVLNRSARLRFSIKSVVLTVTLIGVTFALSLISAGNCAVGGERVYARQRLQNMLAREIKRAAPDGIIKNADITLTIYGDPSGYNDLSDILDEDSVDLQIWFASVQDSLSLFAHDCREVMDALDSLPCGFNDVSFAADDGGNRYSLKLSWIFQSELSAEELIPLIGYYGEEITIDIPDLVDSN